MVVVVVDDERSGFQHRGAGQLPRRFLPLAAAVSGEAAAWGPAHETKPPPLGDRGESGRRGGGGGQSKLCGERGRGEPFWLEEFTGSLWLVGFYWGAHRAHPPVKWLSRYP